MSDRRDKLDRAYAVLKRLVPARLAAAIERLRAPGLRWARLPIGLLLILSSVLWFLPVLGIEFLPLGLLVIAEDVPILRGPVGGVVLWMELRFLRLKRWWRGRRR